MRTLVVAGARRECLLLYVYSQWSHSPVNQSNHADYTGQARYVLLVGVLTALCFDLFPSSEHPNFEDDRT